MIHIQIGSWGLHSRLIRKPKHRIVWMRAQIVGRGVSLLVATSVRVGISGFLWPSTCGYHSSAHIAVPSETDLVLLRDASLRWRVTLVLWRGVLTIDKVPDCQEWRWFSLCLLRYLTSSIVRGFQIWHAIFVSPILARWFMAAACMNSIIVALSSMMLCRVTSSFEFTKAVDRSMVSSCRSSH